MQFREGQVIVSEGNRKSLISKGIAFYTGSWATHAFIYVGNGQGVEATFPRVRYLDVNKRIEELKRKNRAFVVLELPGITDDLRTAVARKAETYVGRFYDVGQLLVYMLLGKFWKDGTGTLVCSRLVTAAHYSVGEVLFDEETLAKYYPPCHPRLDNLRRGYATPVDLLTSRLEVVDFCPSSRIRKIEDFLVRGGCHVCIA